MQIGIYDPYLDDVGGGEKYMMTLAECLAKQHDVTVFWDNDGDLAKVTEQFSLDLKGITRRKNIFSPKVSFFERAGETKKYDVIIYLSDGSIPLIFSKKLFIHIQQPLQSLDYSSLKAKLKLSRVDGIIYNSQFTANLNKKLFPKVRSIVLYPPVTVNQKPTKKENIILHVGRFRPKNVGVEDYKKQAVMIDAFKSMIDHNLKDWKFVIATALHPKDEAIFDQLKKTAQGYPIEFLINKSNQSLWEVFNKAKIYWHASGFGEDLKAHPEFAEHFGISTVEAMGAGAVPVVINAGGQKEIITEDKDGLLWNTLDELRRKTKRLIDNQKVWESLSEQAQIRAKDFSKERFCSEISHLIQK